MNLSTLLETKSRTTALEVGLSSVEVDPHTPIRPFQINIVFNYLREEWVCFQERTGAAGGLCSAFFGHMNQSFEEL